MKPVRPASERRGGHAEPGEAGTAAASRAAAAGRGLAGPLGFEPALWRAADKLRGSMDASEYKHVVLGLIFLKFIADAFDERRVKMRAEPAGRGISSDAAEAVPGYRDEYADAGTFWVPPRARWRYLRERAAEPEIGKLIDEAMDLIGTANRGLSGVLPASYAGRSLDSRRLGELVELISGIGLSSADHRGRDILGRVYEYFLGRFASAEGKSGGEFYTPQSIVRLLVEMIEPLSGRVYDGCCGSGGMFVQAERFVRAHGGERDDICVFGQELNDATWRLARMNLAIRGIDADLGPSWADTFHEDAHPDLVADYIMANPPFNVSDWGQGQLLDDPRWRYGVPPAGNANYAWLQHFAAKLSARGVAGIVMPNGSLSSQHSGEREIRRRLADDDIVECVVALPGQLFYQTPIPASLWFLNRDKRGTHSGGKLRDRRGEILFIDGRSLGVMADRTHRELTGGDVERISGTYHAWRGQPDAGEYADVPGFCARATVDQVAGQGFVLAPGRYVGTEAVDEDGAALDEKIARLRAELTRAFAASDRLREQVSVALEMLDD